MLRAILLSSLIMLIFSTQSQAEIFTYIDASGRKVYVDKQHKIPPEFRQQGKTRVIEVEKISDQEKQDQALKRDLSNKKQQLKRQLRELEHTIAKMETQVIIRGNQVIVPVNVRWRNSKRTLNLLLDTGASITVLHQSAVAPLNAVGRDTGYAQVAGGGTIKTERVVFDQVVVGPYDFDNKSTAVIENSGHAGFDGLLGMDILGRIRYEINFTQSKIIWSPTEYAQMKAAVEEIKVLQAEAKTEVKTEVKTDPLKES